jgi:hypothetical protein
MRENDSAKRSRNRKLNGHVLTSVAIRKIDDEPKPKRGRRKRKQLEFSTNVETLSMNAVQTRNVLGLPLVDGADDWLVFFGG